MERRPTEVNILGIIYKIDYKDKPSDVDIHRRNSYWGQIDFWTRTIRVYDDGNRPIGDIFQTILHEVLHGIVSELNIESLETSSGSTCNDDLDIISVALSDVLVRNGFVTFND